MYKGGHRYVCVDVLSDFLRLNALLQTSKNIRALTTVCALMSYHIFRLTECLITLFKGIRALTSMYALMFYQTVLSTEFLITNTKNIRALTTVYALISYQIFLLTECLITHHRHKGTHHYACVDVLSDCSFD